jgi:hypothetical protein
VFPLRRLRQFASAAPDRKALRTPARERNTGRQRAPRAMARGAHDVIASVSLASRDPASFSHRNPL